MVTMPSRGSLICISIAVATICLMRPANRRARAASAISVLPSLQIVVIKDPPAGGQQVDVRPLRQQPFARVEDLARVPVVAGHEGHRDLGAAVEVLRPGL